ncbi:hypothetical protein LIER_33748 [Lithospermum erythrorhizon]|uniref:Uncharacterized protein n=1 Tax=Lithospermum erythrorhizon TaxID=34254 RepID=A0AAV3S031_LITER
MSLLLDNPPSGPLRAESVEAARDRVSPITVCTTLAGVACPAPRPCPPGFLPLPRRHHGAALGLAEPQFIRKPMLRVSNVFKVTQAVTKHTLRTSIRGNNTARRRLNSHVHNIISNMINGYLRLQHFLIKHSLISAIKGRRRILSQ